MSNYSFHKPTLKSRPLPDQLSGDKQERVTIARAIVSKPPLILADEHRGSLNSNTTKEIMELLKSLNQEGRTIIMVSHNKDMSAYSSRIINIVNGMAYA